MRASYIPSLVSAMPTQVRLAYILLTYACLLMIGDLAFYSTFLGKEIMSGSWGLCKRPTACSIAGTGSQERRRTENRKIESPPYKTTGWAIQQKAPAWGERSHLSNHPWRHSLDPLDCPYPTHYYWDSERNPEVLFRMYAQKDWESATWSVWKSTNSHGPSSRFGRVHRGDHRGLEPYGRLRAGRSPVQEGNSSRVGGGKKERWIVGYVVPREGRGEGVW